MRSSKTNIVWFVIYAVIVSCTILLLIANDKGDYNVSAAIFTLLLSTFSVILVRSSWYLLAIYGCIAYSNYSKSNWEKKKALVTGIPDMTIVTPSEWLAGLVKDSFLKEYQVRVINNGVDKSRFQPVESDFSEKHGMGGKKILLGVSTAWNDMKGWADFIKLAGMLDDNYQIVMLGMTKKQLRRLPGNIIGIERTSSVGELVKIYSAADVLLNLSYCETYPTVILEARACGIPVITYDAGGSAEAAGSDSLTVRKGDLRGIVKELENIPKRGGRGGSDPGPLNIEQFIRQYLILFEGAMQVQ